MDILEILQILAIATLIIFWMLFMGDLIVHWLVNLKKKLGGEKDESKAKN